jgi:CheY-like chemotaxis protein
MTLSESGRPLSPLLLKGIRVLVVDDDEDTADLFVAALTMCGADVSTARSAADAFRIVSARAPHVVVSDIAMPGGDGYWLVRQNPRPGGRPNATHTGDRGDGLRP